MTAPVEPPARAPERRTRRWWFVAAAILAAAAVVLAVVFTMSGGSKRRASHRPAGDLARSSSEAAQALTSAERTLVASAHFIAPATCEGLPDEETNGITAKVVCGPDADTADSPENLFIYQVADSAALNRVATGLYGSSPDFSGCSDAPAAATWSKDGGPTIGNLYCAVGETSGSPIFGWSYQDDNVFVHAQAGKSKPHADLYKWWRSVDVDLG